MKKLFILLTVFFVVSQSTAFSITISLFDAADHSEIAAWKSGLGHHDRMIEDFENISAGWHYPSLDTSIGTFSKTDNSLVGTGTSSYNTKHDPDSTDPYFEVRDYDENGRKNTTPRGSNYLDSADITELKLTLLDGLNLTNMFFYLSDPSDVRAMTKTATSSADVADADINYSQSSGSLWFVGISSEEVIESVLWSVYDSQNTNNYYANDGFGLDDFSTVAAPEPSTFLLLGGGLLGLGWYGRKRKRA